MNQKRVLYIIYSLNAGGIESLAINIFRNIDRRHFKIDFLVVKEPGKKQFYDDEVLRLGGTIIAVGNLHANKVVKYLTTERDIYRAIKNENYDVVHIHSGHVHTLPEVLISKMLGIKNICVHSHNGRLTKAAKFYHLRCGLQWVYRHSVPHIADHLLTCSDLAMEWAFSKKAIASGRVVQINNGVDISLYQFNPGKRANFRRKIGVRDELLIGHIGRMSAQKNHQFLFHVFREVLNLVPDAKLLLCGTGELEPELKQLARELGIDKSTIFFGVTEEIPAVLSAIDAFVFPSLFEGLPVVGIEAQAAGVPVVASDAITREVAITPCWHTVSLTASAESWAEAVLRLSQMTREMKTAEMIKRAGFDIIDTAQLLSSVYDN